MLQELNISIAPYEQHKKVFTDIPRINFKNGLKYDLVKSILL